MLNIFLQWEQEGPRSDATAFCRKRWRRSTHIQQPWLTLSKGSSSGGQEQRDAGGEGGWEREAKAPSSPSGDGEKPGAHWDTPPASLGDSKDMSLREQRARIPLQLQPLQSPRQLWGAWHSPGVHAKSQVPAPKISPTACQQSSVISIQKKTNSGLTPGTDKLPGC